MESRIQTVTDTVASAETDIVPCQRGNRQRLWHAQRLAASDVKGLDRGRERRAQACVRPLLVASVPWRDPLNCLAGTIAAELGDARRFRSAPRAWRLSASCRPSIPAARNRRAARSPKTGMPICGECSSKRRGIIGTAPSSGPPCADASRARRRPSSRRPGPRSSAYTVATIDSPAAGNRTNRSSRPWPANSPALSGPR